MNESDFLIGITQLAIALIAFTNIVVALRQMGGGDLSQFQLLIVKLFSVCGFCAVFFALLPILMAFFGMPDQWVWKICNPLLAVAVVLIHIWYFRRRALVAPGRSFNFTNFVNLVIMIVAVGLLIGGATELVFANTVAPYAFALVGLLIASAMAFLRTLPDFLTNTG